MTTAAETRDIVPFERPGLPANVIDFNSEQMQLLRETIAKDCNPQQFSLFLEVARHKGLDPFAAQIYPVIRGGKLTIQTGIDGYRLVALRTGEYAGQDGPYWCGEDGVWKDVWLSDQHPAAAKVGIRRKGIEGVTWGVVTWREYVQTDSGGIASMWKKMGSNQLAKCAEAQGLRKSFAQELSGVYTDDEMGQADSTPPSLPPPEQRPAAQAKSSQTKKAAAPASRADSNGEVIEAKPTRASSAPVKPAEAAEETLADFPPWIGNLKKQLNAWGLKMNACAPHTGAPVTPRVLMNWLKKQPLDTDPFAKLLELVQADQVETKAEEGAENWVPAEALEVDPADLPFEE
jgi:phage recombination protein Bet